MGIWLRRCGLCTAGAVNKRLRFLSSPYITSGFRAFEAVRSRSVSLPVLEVSLLTPSHPKSEKCDVVISHSSTGDTDVLQAYGKTTFLITNLETCPRGTEGAISFEGSAAGMTTALAYSILALLLHQVCPMHMSESTSRSLDRRFRPMDCGWSSDRV